jgi:hypothetical protein
MEVMAMKPDESGKRDDDREQLEDGEAGGLEETLDRERHGSGEYDPEERYGRRDVEADRTQAEPGDEED